MSAGFAAEIHVVGGMGEIRMPYRCLSLWKSQRAPAPLWESENLVAFAKHLIESAKEELLPILKKADKDDFMTKKEVVKLFGICPTTLWNWEKKGYLVPIRVEDSQKIHYLRSDIEQIIQKRGL